MRAYAFLVLAPLLTSCRSPEVARADMVRDARAGCEKKNASSCFLAGSLAEEDAGGASRALRFHEKGCALKHAGSCDALAHAKGPEREAALAEGCNAGDLLSCTRLADGYGKDAAGVSKAKEIYESVCRMGLAVKADSSSRELSGAASGCAKLAAMATDPVRALRLEAVATTLRTEALFRFEREEDARTERALTVAMGSVTEKNRVQREGESAKKARDELAAAPGSANASAPAASSEPGIPATSLERVFLGRALALGPAPAGTDDAAICRETGDPIACAIAAAAAEKSDPAGAVEMHVAGCAKKPDPCWSLVAYAETLLKRREAPRAAALLEKGCELKSPVACTRLAGELEQGERGIAQDLGKATRTFDKACELGSPRACLALAALAEDGRGTAKNPARAKTLRTKADGLDKTPLSQAQVTEAAADEEACRKGRDAARCSAAAAALQEVDAVKAEELHKIGCAANAQTCGLWSFAVDRLRKDDASRGMRLLEQGCQASAPLACHVLADLQHLGFRTVPRAEAKSVESYQRACDLGDLAACRASAARLRAGLGVPKNAAKADELRDKANKTDEDAARAEASDKWARDAADQRTRGPHVADLERARGEYRTFVAKANARAQLRAQRLESGGRGTPLAPFAKEDVDASAAREAAIKKSVAALLAAPSKK